MIASSLIENKAGNEVDRFFSKFAIIQLPKVSIQPKIKMFVKFQLSICSTHRVMIAADLRNVATVCRDENWYFSKHKTLKTEKKCIFPHAYILRWEMAQMI